jgi:hypothetical protein
LEPGTPYLYSFSALNTISIVPEAVDKDSSKKTNNSGLHIRVESDKPLEIGR